MRPVRQVRQRGGQLDLQPAFTGVPADRLVPPGLVFLPVGGQEQPGRFPLPPPPGLGQARGGEVAALAQQGLPAPHHGHRPGVQLLLHPAEPCLQRLEPDGLGVPLGGGGIPARPPRLPACRDRQPGLDRADAGLQAGLPGAQVLLGEPDLVLAGPRDRSGPPGRRGRRQRPLPPGPGHCLPLRVQPPLAAPGRQVPSGQRPQVSAHRPQHRLIPRRHAQPCPHPRSARRRRHEWRRNRAEDGSHQPAP